MGGSVLALVVDHNLRQGSASRASWKRSGLVPSRWSLGWCEIRADLRDPNPGRDRAAGDVPVKTGPRVCLIGPMGMAAWTVSTRRALEDLGCLVHTVHYDRSGAQARAYRVRARIFHRLRLPLSAFPDWLRQWVWVFLAWQDSARLVAEAASIRPDIVLVLKGETLLPRTLREIKRRTGAALATWWVDSPLFLHERHPWLVFPRCVSLYDHLFVFDHAYVEPLRRLGARALSFLPCAADPAIYHPETLGWTDRERLSSTICLIGTFYPARGRVVERLLDHPGLAIWGQGWEVFLGRHRGRGGPNAIWRGIGMAATDVNRAYQVAMIVLNIHHPQTKRGGLNMRAFEVPASGAFQLMDYVSEMEPMLSPGRDVACFQAPAEAADLVREFLGSTEVRRRIAEAGRVRVLAEHTYRHRMEKVLATL